MKAIEALLQAPPGAVHSVVTFVGGAKAKTAMPDNVFFGGGMTDYIMSFREVVFTDEEFYRAFEAVYVSAEPATRATRRRHVAQVRARVARKKQGRVADS